MPHFNSPEKLKATRDRWTRNIVRAITYWICRWFNRDALYEILDASARFVACRTSGYRPYHGIRLIAYTPIGIDALAEVVEALELVRQTDPRRFHRIEEYVRDIVLANWRPDWLGSFWPLYRVCHLRKQVTGEERRFVVIYSYAATLVHEATHGLLHSKRFPHTKANKQRIERLCGKEATRFTKKLIGRDMGIWEAYREHLAMLAGEDCRRRGASRAPR